MLGSIVRRIGSSLIYVLIGMGGAQAEADGPDFWSVARVDAGDVLNMRAVPRSTSRKVGEIPPNVRGLKNLGCQGGPTFSQWSRMTLSDRKAASKDRWCMVEYGGKRGWVAGRYLAE